ncbi:MAG: AI-2E family transporter, partial [Chloroflexota bacterium]
MLRITLTVTLTAAGLLVLWVFRPVIGLYLLALLITVTFRPLVQLLRQARLPAGIAMLLALLAVAALLGGGIFLAAPQLSAELQRGLVDFNGAYNAFYNRAIHTGSLAGPAGEALPPPSAFPTLLPGLSREQITQFLAGTTMTLFEAGSQLLLIAILSVYLAVDQVHFQRLWLSLISPARRTLARQIYLDIEESLGSYIRSELVQSAAALAVL